MAQRPGRVAAVVAPTDQADDALTGYAAAKKGPCRGRDLARCVFNQHLHRDTQLVNRDPVDLGHLRGGDAWDVSHHREVVDLHYRPTRISLRTAKVSGVMWK